MKNVITHGKNLFVSRFVTLSLLVLFAANYRSGFASAPALQERTIENHKGTFPHDAIKIVGYKNLQATDFPTGFQIEVKNISAKPIYFISFVINFPELSRGDMPVSLGQIYWGSLRLMRNSAVAEPTDSSFQPEETVSLKIPPDLARETMRYFSSRNISPKNLILIPQIINFGDGTGYQLGTPFPRSNSNSLRSANSLIANLFDQYPYGATHTKQRA